MATFSINCTLPPYDTTFVQPPNARGTLDIVYSCLAVIVLCTWSILHLNVPVQVTPAGWRQKLMRSLVRTLTKVGWMAFNVLAPEWPFAQALCGLISQRRLQKKFDRYSERDKVPWTGPHTQLANMGGFVVRFDRILLQPDRIAEQEEDTQCVVDKYCCNRLKNTTPQSHQTSRDLHHSDGNLQQPVEAGPSNGPLPTKVLQELRSELRHGKGCPHAICTHRSFGITTWKVDPINTGIARATVASLYMQKFGGKSLANEFHSADPQEWLANLRALCGDRWSLDGSQLAHARKLGIIEKLPRMTEDEIDDLNKSDVFLKVVAVFQIMWLCVQLITRLSRRLPTTQLEVVTLAFAVTSIVTYALFYSRPKDVQTVREVYAIRYPTPAELSQLATMGPECMSGTRSAISMSNTSAHSGTADDYIYCATAILIVFGGMHLLAWNYEFPTQIERRLWQASAIVTLATFPLILLAGVITKTPWFAPHSNEMFAFSVIVFTVIFVAARLFILVEVVRSLAFQPPETFRTTWAANVPHVGS